MIDNPISIPSGTAKFLADKIGSAVGKPVGTATHLNDYLNTLLEGGRLNSTNDVLTALTADEDSLAWDGLEFKTAPHYPNSAKGTNVSGRGAVIRAQTRTGKGVPVPVMLPHSGIWVTIMPPSEGELLELWRIITSDRVDLGRYTFGAIFSATSIITTRRLVDFCISKIETSSVVVEGVDSGYRELISILDLPFLLNGMGIAMYPLGLKYSQACVYDSASCTHIDEGILRPEALAHYNSKAVPEAFRSIISSTAPRSVTKDNVKLYQGAVIPIRKVTIADEINLANDIYLQAPSLQKAISAGEAWVQEVHDSVVDALSMDKPLDEQDWSERNELMLRVAKSSYLRQYESFVTKIDMYEGGIVEDEESIRMVMEALTSSDMLREQFIAKVEAYISETSMAVIGIPKYTCPKGGKSPEVANNGIIGLDPVRLFFKYLIGKVDRVQQRSIG